MNDRSNKQDFFFSFALFIIFALLFTSCAYVQNIMYEQQFQKELSFDKWDVDGNDFISEHELYKGIYKSLDINDNSYLSKSEWSKAYYFFDTYTSSGFGAFNKWNRDNDNYLDKKAFKKCFSSSKLYTAWDKDKNEKLDNAEFSSAIFDTWDINDDATLSSYEVENWRKGAI